jgi:hypothetical protein
MFSSRSFCRGDGNMFRLAPHLLLFLWPAWRRIGLRMQPAWRREDFLGTFAPLAIVLLLVVWFAALIVGFGLILHALQDQLRPQIIDYETAFYVAGTSLLTIGFGDIVATAAPARIAVVLAGAAGLTIVALVIALAFNSYVSFARREVLVLVLDARAGVPPSGVMLLETYGCHALIDLTQVRFARRRVDFAGQGPSIERAEFDSACRQLAEAGYPISCNDASWQAIAQRRAAYASRLNLLASYFASPPTQWIGDRTLLTRVHAAHFGR